MVKCLVYYYLLKVVKLIVIIIIMVMVIIKLIYYCYCINISDNSYMDYNFTIMVY